MKPTRADTQPARGWTEAESSRWARHTERLDRAVAAYDGPLLSAAEISPHDTVLDIGCGSGKTTRDAARRAVAGRALGVDLSADLVSLAETLAQRDGVRNTAFVCADAQVYPFAESFFDVALSRNGASFFADPVAAFSNVASGLRTGGRLAVLAWQSAASNEWVTAFSAALDAGRHLPLPGGSGPGPHSFGDPSRFRGVLESAGFTGVKVTGHEEPMHFGSDTSDAFQFITEMFGWKLDGLGGRDRSAALEALRADVAAHDADGVRYGSAVWIATAVRP